MTDDNLSYDQAIQEWFAEYWKRTITLLPITQEPPEDGYDGE